MAFLQSLNNFDKLLGSSYEPATELYNEIYAQMNNMSMSGQFGADRLGLNGFNRQISNAITGGFISACSDLNHGAVSVPEMKRVIDKNVALEPGFIEMYTSKLNLEIRYNYELSKHISAGGKRLEKLIGHYNTRLSESKNNRSFLEVLLGIKEANASAIAIVAVAAVLKFMSKR